MDNFEKQTNYELQNVKKKWPYVLEHINKSNKNVNDGKSYLNGLNANGLTEENAKILLANKTIDIIPGVNESPPTPKDFSKVVNAELRTYLAYRKDKDIRLGIVPMDFPGKQLVKYIIQTNF